MNSKAQPAATEAREALARIQAKPTAQQSPEDRALALFLQIKTGALPSFTI